MLHLKRSKLFLRAACSALLVTGACTPVKTNFTSYPDPGSEECTRYNGCT